MSKTATPAGIDSLGYIPASSVWLEYTIEFQNTTTDTILSLIIKDQLDSNIDWSSFTPLASSHPVQISVSSLGEVVFIFDSLFLPNSSIDLTNSFVFVNYGINIKPNTPAGTSIYNSALIYIDSDSALITNTEINTLYDCNSIIENLSIVDTVCFSEMVSGEVPNCPSDEMVMWDLDGFFTSSGINFTWLSDSSGTFDLTVNATTDFCSGDTTILVTVEEVVDVNFDPISSDTLCSYSGFFILSANPVGGIFSGQGVSANQFDPAIAGTGSHTIYYSYTPPSGCSSSDSILVYVDGCLGSVEINPLIVSISPNPFNEYTTTYFGQEIQGQYVIQISDLLGQIVYTTNQVYGSKIEIKSNNLNSGVYLFSLIDWENNTVLYTTKIIKE